MAKRRKTKGGKQLPLIDVTPTNAKKIKEAARAYKDALAQRISWQEDEKEHKARILTLVEEAGLQPLDDGVIRFTVDGMTIVVTPREKLVRVKEDGEAKEDRE